MASKRGRNQSVRLFRKRSRGFRRHYTLDMAKSVYSKNLQHVERYKGVFVRNARDELQQHVVLDCCLL